MPQGDVIVGGSISANSTSQTAPAPNSTANFNASGVSGGSMQVTGTFVGTLVPEGSLTGAPGDWQAAPIANLAGTPATSITAPGFFTFNAETFVFFRLRSTAWTSGTAAVVFKASPGAGPSAAGTGGGGGAVTVADGADVTQGTTTDVAAATDTANTTIVAFWKRLLSRLTTLLPQTANGLKVDNSAVTQPVSAASLPLPTGAAADATLGTTNTEIGGLTETAPATDIASSGLNGRLQRMAQRMTSLIALLPAALVSGRLDVNLGAAPATVSEQGDVAHATADSGNPVKHGAVAIAHGTNPAPVAAAARTNLYANRAGVPFIIGGHPNPITVRANFTTAQTNTVLVAGSVGSKIVVTGFMVTASNANTANVSVVLGLAASVTPTAGQVVGAHPGIAAGSGFGRGAGAGMLGVGADADALLLTSSVPSGGSIDVLVQYFTSPS